MKRLLILISIIAFLSVSCAQMISENRISILEKRVNMLEGTLGSAEFDWGQVSADAYHCSGGLTGGGAGALDAIANPADKDIAFVHFNDDATYGNSVLVYTFDVDSAIGEASPNIIAPDTGSGEWELCQPWGRDFRKIYLTNGDSQRTLTVEEMLTHLEISNNGDSVESDVKFSAISHPIKNIVSVEEVLIIEVCPPTGELFNMNGTDLAVNDCIDSPAIVGSSMLFRRILLADGTTWRWYADTIRGAWLDTDATD